MSVVCSPVRHAHCTNMGVTHLVDKLITVCVLCPLLTPTTTGATASRQAPSRWDSLRGEGLFLTGLLSLKTFSSTSYLSLFDFTSFFSLLVTFSLSLCPQVTQY